MVAWPSVASTWLEVYSILSSSLTLSSDSWCLRLSSIRGGELQGDRERWVEGAGLMREGEMSS